MIRRSTNLNKMLVGHPISSDNAMKSEQAQMRPKNLISLRQRGYTLVELITVIAITAVLLTIIVYPVFTGFNSTRTAQAFSEAQSRARQVTEQLAKEISNASVVRDPNGIGGLVNVEVPVPKVGRYQNNVLVNPAIFGSQVRVGLPFSKLDMFMPAAGDPTKVRGGYVNPGIDKTDPTLGGPRGQVVLPVAPGTTMKRIWVGLRDPLRDYTNPYDGLLMSVSGTSDNLFVLYMAEVDPLVFTTVGGIPTITVNQSFFDADTTSAATGGTAYPRPIYDDPNFFLPNRTAGGNIITDDAKALRIRNWQKRAKVLTEITRYDLITPLFDRSTRQIRLQADASQGGWIPVLNSLIQLRPSHVENNATEGQVAVRMGEETDNGSVVGPDVFQTQFGQWSNPVIRVKPKSFNGSSYRQYSLGRPAASGNGYTDYQIFITDPTAADDATGGLPVFNVSEYLRDVKAEARYPFIQAMNVTGNWSPVSSAPVQRDFEPFFTLSQTGKVVTSFPIAHVGNPSVAPTQVNLPEQAAGQALTPSNDPTPVGNGINQVFNRIWNGARATPPTYPVQLGEVGGAHRFVDLRVALPPDGFPGPLHPNTPFGLSSFGGFNKVSITPGSDEVFGPDQRPGPNYGTEVRYQRVNREPGPNEYRINYVNLEEPSNYSLLGAGFYNPPATYTPGDLMSEIIQPRFKAGYVQLCSQPEVPIPATMSRVDPNTGLVVTGLPGTIRVAYKFQFTDSNDLVSVDYDTRQLIQVLLTVRNYPQADVPTPQTVTLKSTATVRNYIR